VANISLATLKGLWENVSIAANGYPNYNADSLSVTSTTVDASYTFDFSSKRFLYIRNDGANDVYLSFTVTTGTAKKTILLKAYEGLENIPLGGVTSIKAKLTATGSTTIRFMVVG
jgi:hypothetical protein